MIPSIPIPQTSAPACVIDVPSTPDVQVAPGADLTVSGWAFGAADESLLPEIAARVRSEKTGQTIVVPGVRVARPDVARHFGNPELLMCGFNVRLPITYRHYGRYSVSLLQMGAGRTLESPNCIHFETGASQYELAARAGLASRFLRGKGIEIGALQRRLPLPPSCSVTYVDRMPYAELIAHYPELRDLPVQVPDVIDDGETLSSFGDASLDFVVANHMIEHCLNPVATIGNFLRVLAPGGMLFMAVPDKRWTFDIDRASTSYEVLRDTAQSGARSDRSDLYFDWAVHVLRLEGEAAKSSALSLDSRNYSIHYNVWTLEELLGFLLTAKADFRLPFGLASVATAENENIVVLEKA